MQYVILGAVGLALLFGLVRLVTALDTRTLAKVVRYTIAAVLIVGGIGLTVARQFAFGLPAIAIGLAALFRGRIGGFDLGGGSKSPGRTSTVRARFIEATLDHDSGNLGGTVREGRFAGRSLDDLDEAALRDLHGETAIDADSAALVEAYLDRRFPGWRVDGDGTAGPRPAGATDSGAMTDKEAYEILGLPPGAGQAEIRAAHRRLLKGVHPDQGGSNFLAVRINQAKDRLLGGHR